MFVPLSHLLISSFGWRTTLLVLGFTIWGLALIPVVFLVRRRPEDMGLRPDGDCGEEGEAETSLAVGASDDDSVEQVWSLREALRTRTLWLLLIGFNITGLALSGVFIHFYPYLESKGIEPGVAATAVTTFAFCAAMVKIPWGLLAERFPVRHCITACYVGCALSLIILINSQSVALVFLYAMVYGVTLGGDMVLKELVWANYFGRTFLGTIRGVTMPVNLISVAGGPLFAAWLRDLTGSYQLPYTIFFGTVLVGTCVLCLTKPPRKGGGASSGLATGGLSDKPGAVR